MTELHRVLSNTTYLFFLALGLWGLFRAIRRESVDGSYLGAMIIGQLLFVVQAVLGTILWLQSARPAQPDVHLIYGVFALVFPPFMFAYLRGDDSNRAQWVYAFVMLFMFGIALRAIGTGV